MEQYFVLISLKIIIRIFFRSSETEIKLCTVKWFYVIYLFIISVMFMINISRKWWILFLLHVIQIHWNGQLLDSSSFTSAFKTFSNTQIWSLSAYQSINQSITVFCPRIGLSLKTEPSPLYPLLSLPFRIWIQSIYHNVVYHLISSFATIFLPVYHSFIFCILSIFMV